jgi:hypothetical protein
MEQEVFSMPKKLGISSDGSLDKLNHPQTARRMRKKKKGSSSTERQMSMSLHGPLYSTHLLNGLRHLNAGFAKPSPLALNILPRVQSLGLSSFILGVSTAFYNELISIYWTMYADLDAIIPLFDEMEYGGLASDRDTLRVLDNILAEIEGLGSFPHLSSSQGVRRIYEEDISRLSELQDMRLRISEHLNALML